MAHWFRFQDLVEKRVKLEKEGAHWQKGKIDHVKYESEEASGKSWRVSGVDRW